MGIFKTWEYFGSQKNLLLILDAVNFHIGNFSNLKNKNCFVGLIFFNFVKKMDVTFPILTNEGWIFMVEEY